MPVESESGGQPLLEVREPLLDVRDLRIAFGGQEAVRGVSFAIAAGETLGLVGESGSGKSATSLAMMRLLPASARVSGSVRLHPGLKPPARRGDFQGAEAPCSLLKTSAAFEAEVRRSFPSASEGFGVEVHETLPSAVEELLTLPEAAMRRLRGREVAMVFQEPMTALNPVMKVGRQIAEALLAHAPRSSRKVVRERVAEAMREVGLPEGRVDEHPHQFSGGQRQRIVIAMALMNKPKLLIADEPTTALDVTVQAQVLSLLNTLRERHGLAMLFISHDLAVVAQVADRVAVMRQGEIVEMGSVMDVMTRPQHPYTKGLLASAPTMRTDRERPLQQGVGSRE